MRAFRRLTVLPLLAVTGLALGCGSDSAAPVDPGGGEGALSFTFTGTSSGSFSASGPMHGQSEAWAAALREGNALDIRAFRARSSSRGDVAFLWLEDPTPGTYSIANDEAWFDFITNTTASWTAYDRECWLENGSVVVTAVAGQRIQGTFSGAGECLTFDWDSEPFSVASGQFDVPIVD
jgi:hypothetical protein